MAEKTKKGSKKNLNNRDNRKLIKQSNFCGRKLNNVKKSIFIKKKQIKCDLCRQRKNK